MRQTEYRPWNWMILRAIIIIEQFKLLEVVEPGGSKYGINHGKVTRTIAPTEGESMDRALWVRRVLRMVAISIPTVPPLTLASRLRGAERQRGRHHRESIYVRAASLPGRMVMMPVRISSGRRLIRSSPRGASSGLLDSSSSLHFLALVTTPICLPPPASLPINKILVPKSRIFLQN